MNKPAPKEPSMDEILSSIRQIIADDDAAGSTRRPSAHQPSPPPMQAAPAPGAEAEGDRNPDENTSFESVLEEIEPLALSRAQIVAEDNGDETESSDSDHEADAGDDDLPSSESLLAEAAGPGEPEGTAEPEKSVTPETGSMEPEDVNPMSKDDAAEFSNGPEVSEPDVMPQSAAPDRAEPENETPIAEDIMERDTSESFAEGAGQHASMPDPDLSREMAERLLEPATNAAVRSTFARLGNMGLGAQDVTIESMVRDMLRPMLKEWLDENLPSVVERMVEREITRISRGE